MSLNAEYQEHDNKGIKWEDLKGVVMGDVVKPMEEMTFSRLGKAGCVMA